MIFFSIIKTLLFLCAASFTLVLLATPSSAYIVRNHLVSGRDILYNGQSLVEGSSELLVQGDCGFILYDRDVPVWIAPNTYNRGRNCYAKLETDGNLVLYDDPTTNRRVWASGTAGQNGDYILVLQRNGNLALYGNLLWSTGTAPYKVAVDTAHNMTVQASSAEKNKVEEMEILL